MKKLLAAVAPAIVLAAIAVWSTCRVVGAGAGVPGDAAWEQASHALREQYQPGDLIVFAPRWIDPVGRLHLGDLIPVDMAARLDAARYSVIWELTIRGARAAETHGLKPIWQASFGGVTVRRFAQTPAVLVEDLAAAAAAGRMKVEGLVQAGTQVKVVLAEVGFEPHRCVEVVPSADQTVTLTFDGVALGDHLDGAVGLADAFTRREVRAPAELAVAVGDREVARKRVGVDDGWVRFHASTTPGTATITITAQAIGKRATNRLVCFALETRG